jgi:hypothetical protein
LAGNERPPAGGAITKESIRLTDEEGDEFREWVEVTPEMEAAVRGGRTSTS